MISLDKNFIPCLSFRRAFVCFLFSTLAYKLIIIIKKQMGIEILSSKGRSNEVG
jgi:hypothetical protein